MSKAEELAQNYADAVSTHRLESLYGTSKGYTLEKARERDEAHSALSAELRRLAEVERDRDALARHCEKLEADNAALRGKLDAIYETEPAAWKHDCAALLQNDIVLWVSRCPHCGKPKTYPPKKVGKQMSDELESALEALVNRCNNDADLTNDDAVISAEAALERLYRSRTNLPERKS